MSKSKKCLIILTLALISFNSYSQNNTAPFRQLEKNKELVQQMNNLFNTHKLEEALSFFSDSLVKVGNINGKSFFLAMHDDILQTFPDVQTKIVTIWAEGDWVIADCLFSGTHKGTATLPHHGGLLVGKLPTNKQFKVQHIRMYKIKDGKIVDRKAVRDDLGMYQQLGIVELPSSFPHLPVKSKR